MTWSADGTRWLVDDRPWLDELRWAEVLHQAQVTRGRRPATSRGQLIEAPACGTCHDDGCLAGRDGEGRWFTVPCPDCEPESYRTFVQKGEQR